MWIVAAFRGLLQASRKDLDFTVCVREIENYVGPNTLGLFEGKNFPVIPDPTCD